ncbi:GAF domain-containing protein [Kallotenue papyrolyticum]|uniref:GAF domain-containing protein n=1 Tax=Kallotenue papyrolyticum TaxID=1325125 RepID=UPI00049229F7|nr:GAF domain-containing protein [Kallotenue papyrolyticum]
MALRPRRPLRSVCHRRWLLRSYQQLTAWLAAIATANDAAEAAQAAAGGLRLLFPQCDGAIVLEQPPLDLELRPGQVSSAVRAMLRHRPPGAQAELRLLPGEQGMLTLLVAPIEANGQRLGAIGLARSESRRWSAEEHRLVEDLAHLLGQSLHSHHLRRTLQSHEQELAAVVATAVAISAPLELDATLHAIVERATHLAQAAGGSLYLYDEARGDLEIVISYRLSRDHRGQRLPLGEGVAGRAAQSGQVLHIVDYPHWPGRAPHFSDVPYYTVLAVPLLRDGRALGVIDLVHTEPGRSFSPREIAIVELLAAQASVALTNARLYQAARESDRLKTEFISTVSHELRTPMGAILGYSELLLSGLYGQMEAHLYEPLTRIKANADRLLQLINQMLDLSRIEAGRLHLHIGPFQPRELIAACRQAIAADAAARGLRLETSVAADVPQIVLGDVGRLQQMLLCLCSNSLKFTTSGMIALRCAITPGATPLLLLSVEDTGSGIAPEQLPHIWESFRQGDGSLARPAQGAGLGLALVQRLARLMGGDVTVQSAPGMGSTFTIRVPLRLPEREDSL